MKNYVVNIINNYGNFAGIWYATMMEDLDTLIISNEGIVVWDLIPNYSFCNFMPSCSECQENELFYYHPDHLGSTGMVTDNNANITKGYLYAPFGEIISEQGGLNNNIPKYAFNAKEFDEENGMYYYSARYYVPPSFISRDVMFEKYFWISPYAYCSNNPVNIIDPTGKDVEITGTEQKAAYKELKTGAAQYDVKVKMDRNGQISGQYTGKGEMSGEAKGLLNAINDKSVNVKINATSSNTTEGGLPFFGGAFLGSTLDEKTVGKDDVIRTGTATARQDVNPENLNALSNCNGKPGQDMLHEITEAYLGGLTALKTGNPVLNSNADYDTFLGIHNSAAVPQSGSFEEKKILNTKFEHIGFRWEVGSYIKEWRK